MYIVIYSLHAREAYTNEKDIGLGDGGALSPVCISIGKEARARSEYNYNFWKIDVQKNRTLICLKQSKFYIFHITKNKNHI